MPGEREGGFATDTPSCAEYESDSSRFGHLFLPEIYQR